MKKTLQQAYNKPVNKLFFIGIGGSSMSGLAEMALDQGLTVEGSDMAASAATEKLINRGITVHIGHDASNVPADADLVVYSAAIKPENPDRVRAKALSIPEIERSDYLGLLSRVFPKTIGVAGTHGKTTTSSMIATLLFNAGKDPSVSIGGNLDLIDGNSRLGSSDYFVIESCEYVDSFLKTQHYLGIITNIEADHLDYFTGGLPQIKHSFNAFGKIIPPEGRMICYGDSQDVLDAVEGLACPVITYGLGNNNDWQAVNIVYNDQGEPAFDVLYHDEFFGRFELTVPGQHNVLNALAVIAAGDFLDIPLTDIQDTLSHFKGAKRRFEFRGSAGGVNIYEDYAHHPTELKVTINACLNHARSRLWVVFQPHTFSRTYYLFDDFVDAFQGTDRLILSDIYPARETNTLDIYSEDLAKRIKSRHGIPTVVLSDFEDIVKYLKDNVEPGDLVLVAGAGTINRVAFRLAEELRKAQLPGLQSPVPSF